MNSRKGQTMMEYREELYIRLRAMQMMIASGGKVKKKAICNTLGEASIALQEVQSIEAKLDALGKENCELRCRLATYEDAEKRCGAEKQQVINNEEYVNS